MKRYSEQLFEDVQVKRQKPQKTDALKRAYRIAQRHPQAVLKVISWAHDAKSVGDTLSYISREGDLELEDPQGNKLNAEEVKERLAEWSQDFDTWKKRSRESMHMMFSSPQGSDSKAVMEATRDFTRSTFANYDYLMAPHDDTDNPHVHVVVKTRGYDLTKLHPGPNDLREWRDHYARCLRDHGVQVEASPRLMRGFFGRSPPVRGAKAALLTSQDARELSTDPIPAPELSDSQKRAYKRSEAYQHAFEVMGKELVEKGRNLDDKGLLGMGEAIQEYAKGREQTQLEDVQRLYYAKRRIEKAVKEHGEGLGL